MTWKTPHAEDVEVVRELPNFPYQHGEAFLFRYQEQFYVLYSGTGPGMKRESLILSATEEGQVTSWDEIAGGSDTYPQAALDELRRKRGPRTYGEGWPD